MKKKKDYSLRRLYPTFDDLVAWARGRLVISIGEGDFKSTVTQVLDTALRWANEEKP